MEYRDLYFVVRVFDDDLEDWNQYRFEHENTAIDCFRYFYDQNRVVSLRKISIATSFFSNLSANFNWIHENGSISENKKEN